MMPTELESCYALIETQQDDTSPSIASPSLEDHLEPSKETVPSQMMPTELESCYALIETQQDDTSPSIASPSLEDHLQPSKETVHSQMTNQESRYNTGDHILVKHGVSKVPAVKWKRRYFVLSKPAQSLPGTYLLHYFSDENCKRLKGYIDLEQCQEIIESLDSDQFQFLLAIKTKQKGRDRTYFLATDTEEQMSTWVRNLCTVCGMKPDESGSDTEGSPQPPVREELPRKTQITQPSSVASPSHIGVMSKPNISATMPANRNSPSTKARSGVTLSKTTAAANSHNTDRDSEYLPLSDCTSGPSIKRAERQISVDSVPEDFAPPPPGPKGVGRGDTDRDSDVFGTVGSVNNAMIYDVPPSGKHEEEDDELYKVPPPRPSKDNSNLEPYDVLPPHHHSPSTPRSSSSESQKVDSAYSSQGFYDTPPTRGDLTLDDTYDIPPSHNDRHSLDDTPPIRPPKPTNLSSSVPGQEPYMNIPTNSRLLAPQSVDINSVVVLPQAIGMTKLDPAELYDFPRSTLVDNYNNNNNVQSDKVIGMVPPPNSCGGQREHKYINAYHGMVDETQDVYLSMAPVGKPRKSSSTDNEVEYTDMSGRSDFDDSFEGKTVYDHPPPSRPTVPPPRPIKSTLSEAQDTYSIFSNTRTRSFKKKPSEGSPSIKRRSPTSPKVQTSASVKVPLPQRSLDRHPDFSTSDEDDDDMGSPDVWETTVPAPTNKDTELKYVDLDHDEEKEPVRSPHAISSSLTPTEYHEIDFVKTTVLQNLKEQRNKKSSDTT